MLKITEKAIKQIQQRNKPGIYIYVEPGGCAEYKFAFTFDLERCKEPSLRFEFDDVFVISDAENKSILDYVEIDYKSTLVSQKFTANVDASVERCGCGISFKQ